MIPSFFFIIWLNVTTEHPKVIAVDIVEFLNLQGTFVVYWQGMLFDGVHGLAVGEFLMP